MNVENGQTLPAIEGEMSGTLVDLSAVALGSWSVLLFYRGHW